MAQPDLLSSLRELNQRILMLTELQNEQQKEIRVLKEENNNLKADLEVERKKLQQALKDIEFLSVSYRLADSAESIISTRRLLGRLIRTIDNCIRMINEE